MKFELNFLNSHYLVELDQEYCFSIIHIRAKFVHTMPSSIVSITDNKLFFVNFKVEEAIISDYFLISFSFEHFIMARKSTEWKGL